VTGNRVDITLNSTAGSQTTIQQMVDAVNHTLANW
jgi:hypothetical protein